MRARKTGHGALLPLTSEVGAALADYLQHGRPDTELGRSSSCTGCVSGAPISTSIVGRAVERCGGRRWHRRTECAAATCCATRLATGLLAGGASLAEIADLLGHSRLATTRIYAAVDIEPTPRGAAAMAAGRRGHDRRRDRDRRQHWWRSYIALRRGLGYRSLTQERALRAFGRHLDDEGHEGPIPLELTPGLGDDDGLERPVQPGPTAGDGARLPASPGTRLDGATEVPDRRACWARPVTAHRHTSTPTPRSPTCWPPPASSALPAGCGRICYVTLFGLLACTGLRISEALALSCA